MTISAMFDRFVESKRLVDVEYFSLSKLLVDAKPFYVSKCLLDTNMAADRSDRFADRKKLELYFLANCVTYYIASNDVWKKLLLKNCLWELSQ